MKDLKRLINIYFQLKKLGGELYDIEQRHPGAAHLKLVLDTAIRQIDDSSHMIFKEASELKRKTKKNG